MLASSAFIIAAVSFAPRASSMDERVSRR